MQKNKSIIVLSVILISFFVLSCVPSKQYKELKAKSNECDREKEALKNQNKDMIVTITEMNSKLNLSGKHVDLLVKDTTEKGLLLQKCFKEYSDVNKLNTDLLNKLKNLNNDEETKKTLAQLQIFQEKLLKKEDELRDYEKQLKLKNSNLDRLTKELDENNKLLEQKNARLLELERILRQKDSLVNLLKNKVINALTGYINDGLTVTQVNGKVYVSLDEKLLFKSGSDVVDPKGVAALKKLSKVLEANEDINIMIEGHTDDVPYKGVGELKDNWDLSVKRATSIVRILLEGTKIDPKRITASGRSQYLPVDNAKTSDARQKNRRTEIILTPKLDEIFKILNSN